MQNHEESEVRAKIDPGASYLNHSPPTSAPSPLASVAAAHSALKPIRPLPQAHGYGGSSLETQSHIHPQLRTSSAGVPASDMMQRGVSPPSDEGAPISASPVANMAAQGLLGHDPDDSVTDGRKAKRELSQSKRAAQNRAAQRAFRQRKEHYIKKLEQQVRDYGEMEHSFKAIQNDNYALREYVIQLQSRLLDLQVELPQPPPNVNIGPPATASTSARGAHATTAPEPGPNNTNAGTLADVAAAVAGLRAREPSADGLYTKPAYKSESTEDSQTAEEIRRQLQQEGGPAPSSLRA
ncbi:putative transcription factor kapC [Daldinia childiae]|uniref:putative transcription factor kapC n=1 Tax=Daldinia childiae TaxID=326645 RepID=UPI001446E08D|nr:putative transcription factor kapC [Daldinia childiae]KAF3056031.1 putative transcription factor kapC [Daldinia childiae]